MIFAAPTRCRALHRWQLLWRPPYCPVLYKLMGGPRLFRRLVLQESETLEKGYVSKDPHAHSELLGFSGKAVTALRPAGTVEIDGKRLDAISDGSFLPVGTKVRVIETKGSQVVVTAVE